MATDFLDQVRLGKNTWWRYFVGIPLTFFFSILVVAAIAAVLIVGLLIAAALRPMDLQEVLETLWATVQRFRISSIGADTISGADIINGVEGLLGIVGLFLVVRFVHDRPFLTLFTARKRPNWRRIWQGAAVWALLWIAAALMALLIGFECCQYLLQISHVGQIAPLVPLILLAA